MPSMRDDVPFEFIELVAEFVDVHLDQPHAVEIGAPHHIRER